MVFKKTVSIKTDGSNTAELVVSLKGFIEKIEIVYSAKNEGSVNSSSELFVNSSEGEKILQVRGESNKTVYVRTAAQYLSGNSMSFDGTNPVPTRFYVGHHVTVEYVSDRPDAKIDAINFFVDNT